MNSKSTEQQIVIPPANIKSSVNNKVSLNETGLTVIIPAEAGLKHYDLLTIYWKRKNGINKSYPKAITPLREGKKFTYQTPLRQLENHSLLDVWYSFHRAGTDDIKTSPVTTINISMSEEMASVITKELAKKKQFQRFSATEPENYSQLDRADDQYKIDHIVYAKIRYRSRGEQRR